MAYRHFPKEHLEPNNDLEAKELAVLRIAHPELYATRVRPEPPGPPLVRFGTYGRYSPSGQTTANDAAFQNTLYSFLQLALESFDLSRFPTNPTEETVLRILSNIDRYPKGYEEPQVLERLEELAMISLNKYREAARAKYLEKHSVVSNEVKALPPHYLMHEFPGGNNYRSAANEYKTKISKKNGGRSKKTRKSKKTNRFVRSF